MADADNVEVSSPCHPLRAPFCVEAATVGSQQKSPFSSSSNDEAQQEDQLAREKAGLIGSEFGAREIGLSLGAREIEVSETGTSPDSINVRLIAAKAGLMIVAFIVCCVFLEWAAGPEIERFSKSFVERTGNIGLFVMVFIADGFPQPFTYVPLIYISVKGGISKPVVIAVCGSASYTAALMGYGIGWNITKLKWAAVMLERLNEQHPQVLRLMRTRGGAGVAIAALLPVPLALATWTAGSVRVWFPSFLLAGIMRLPKITVFTCLSN